MAIKLVQNLNNKKIKKARELLETLSLFGVNEDLLNDLPNKIFSINKLYENIANINQRLTDLETSLSVFEQNNTKIANAIDEIGEIKSHLDAIDKYIDAETMKSSSENLTPSQAIKEVYGTSVEEYDPNAK